MRKLYFLLPGTQGKFGGGGLWAELKIVKLAEKITEVEIVTYRQRESGKAFLADLLPSLDRDRSMFVVNWGFDVPKLLERLQQYHVIYHAHSASYGFDIPARIPIICVSRNTLGYWGEQASNNLLYHLPNQLGTEFVDTKQNRDIDVLVQTRKNSSYLQQQLIPALQARCRVKVLDGYVADLAAMFNRSKVYLYDSAEYWRLSGVTEGFGLPPLEALACGCQVFSSVNHALADYLDPSFNCHKISCYSLEYDLQRILKVVNSDLKPQLPPSFWTEYQADNIQARLQTILEEIDGFFDYQSSEQTLIPELTKSKIIQLKITKAIAKVKQKLQSNQ